MQSWIIQYGRGCETFPHTLFQREAIIAADETEKYTDIRVILAQLSLCLWLRGSTAAENRKDKVHTLRLEGYRKFDFMLLHLENAGTM